MTSLTKRLPVTVRMEDGTVHVSFLHSVYRRIWIANCRKGTCPKNSQRVFAILVFFCNRRIPRLVPFLQLAIHLRWFFCYRRIPRWRKLILWIFQTCSLFAVSDSYALWFHLFLCKIVRTLFCSLLLYFYLLSLLLLSLMLCNINVKWF
jgi:hypothetical protein